MEVVASDRSGSPEEEVKIENEVLPDGTIHQKVMHVWRTPSLGNDSNARPDSPSTTRSEILETFEQPPHVVEDAEEIEEIMPDGSKRRRSIKMNCLVHSISTRHESIDDGQTKNVEEYKLEEVVPGTVSAFDGGLDSDYEEEVSRKKIGKGNSGQKE